MTPKDILKSTDYYISYAYASGTATVSVAWEKDLSFSIDYDDVDGEMIFASEFDDFLIPCPQYAVPALSRAVTQNICKHYKFPYKYLDVVVNGNPSDRINFPLDFSDEDYRRGNFLEELIDEIELTGLRPDHIDIARELEIFDGFQTYLGYRYGILVQDVYDIGEDTTLDDEDGNNPTNGPSSPGEPHEETPPTNSQ